MVMDVAREGAAAAEPRARPGSEARTLGAICAAHWLSHVHILVLPPLFPFLKESMGVGYIELGLALTIFSVVSGLTQAPMGFLVDRAGPRRILMGGLCLGGLSFVLLGLVPTYPMMLAAMAIAGLANSVYHPADYAILNTGMPESKMGRAFSIHTFAGYLGGAMAPAIVLLLFTTFGLQVALITMGLLGPLIAILVGLVRMPGGTKAAAKSVGTPAAAVPLTAVLTPMVLALMLFFALLSLSNGGLQSFSVPALMTVHGISLSAANIALTAYLATSAAGVLAGGFLADRTRHHGRVAAACFSVTALIILAVGLVPMDAIAIIAAMGTAGFMAGMIAPSRDMLVRATAPPGAAGRVFGIVSTGFNIGGIIGPMLFGWIMDRGEPRWLFFGAVAFMLATILLALATERRRRVAVA